MAGCGAKTAADKNDSLTHVLDTANAAPVWGTSTVSEFEPDMETAAPDGSLPAPQQGDGAETIGESGARHPRYNLRKHLCRAFESSSGFAGAHRTWVEEELDSADLVSYRAAIKHPQLGQKWSEAVKEDLRSTDLNATWDSVRVEDVPPGTHPISSRWVFKTKEPPDGGTCYKARLVIRGCE